MGFLGAAAVLFGPSTASAAWRPTGPAGSEDRGPLLVVVEVGEGAGADATDVRKAISQELGRAVIAPTTAESVGSADVLFVALDRKRIVLSLRGRSDDQVARGIPAPVDRAARLRAVTWLAGNLARDQVAPVLSAASGEASAGPTQLPHEPSLGPRDVATEPPPVPAPAAPPLSAHQAAALEVAVEKARPPVTDEPRWSLTAAGGLPATYVRGGLEGVVLFHQPAWQVEIQRQRPGASLYGLALDMGPIDIHILGLAAIVGSTRSWGRFTLEGSGGLGLEAIHGWAMQNTVTYSSSGGTVSTTTVGGLEALLYARGSLAVGYAVSSSWDVLFRLGAHLTAGRFPEASFVSSTLGLRFRLP
jgi:hypothetical protein